MFASLVILLSLVGAVQGAVEADKVTTLPGYSGDLPSTHYSGYIPTGTTSGVPGQLHYWFIESTNKPESDPVVLWYVLSSLKQVTI